MLRPWDQDREDIMTRKANSAEAPRLNQWVAVRLFASLGLLTALLSCTDNPQAQECSQPPSSGAGGAVVIGVPAPTPSAASPSPQAGEQPSEVVPIGMTAEGEAARERAARGESMPTTRPTVRPQSADTEDASAIDASSAPSPSSSVQATSEGGTCGQ